ncbi:MAG: hypothetical protein ACI9KE_001101 [Polyangiales bacterium]|jgi:hypothetical protein
MTQTEKATRPTLIAIPERKRRGPIWRLALLAALSSTLVACGDDATSPESTPEASFEGGCVDGVDNDSNGRTDCFDESCSGAGACAVDAGRQVDVGAPDASADVNACACNVSASCDVSCSCDPDCSGSLCTDEFRTSNDDECDDGGPDSLFSVCALGTDCADCGPRESPSCTCDVSSSCDAGCACDPDCVSCSCTGSLHGNDYTLGCGESSDFCALPTGTICPEERGERAVCTDTGTMSRSLCEINPVRVCGSCTNSDQCECGRNSFGDSIGAACYAGTCRVNVGPASGFDDYVEATPIDGTQHGRGYRAGDGC